jgi:hypothetical protein
MLDGKTNSAHSFDATTWQGNWGLKKNEMKVAQDSDLRRHYAGDVYTGIG